MRWGKYGKYVRKRRSRVASVLVTFGWLFGILVVDALSDDGQW